MTPDYPNAEINKDGFIEPVPARPAKAFPRNLLFFLTAAACLTPWVSPPIALLLGLVFAQTLGHPYPHVNNTATKILLQVSVVGLGFGMNALSALKAGREGLLFTVVSICGTLLIGFLLGKFLKVDKKTSYLISSGTAICGGSAIAAISPIIKADEKQMSVALGTVFILNSVALLLFPAIGHALNLSQAQFGLWSAIAIHDTSSVVGAASKYGPQALEIATTVKLARALWIIPVALISMRIFRNAGSRIKIPWFIGYFIVAMLLNTYIPFIREYSPYVTAAAKAGLTLTLFLIGAGLSRAALSAVGIKPFIHGVILWILISCTSLLAILSLI